MMTGRTAIIGTGAQSSRAASPLENQWAGIAALVSRQGGCAMEDAKAMAESSRPGFAGPDDAKVAYDALADTNALIFGDIYPPMRFYERHEIEGINRCGDAGPNGSMPPQIKEALQQISSGTSSGIRRGANQIAEYEQNDIVQAQVYSDPEIEKTFAKNQWWAKRPLGRIMGAQKPEIALSADCSGEKISFDGGITVANDRIDYYHRLMNDFERKGAAWQEDAMSEIVRAVD